LGKKKSTTCPVEESSITSKQRKGGKKKKEEKKGFLLGQGKKFRKLGHSCRRKDRSWGEGKGQF